jgi:hypothetical protein
LNKETLFKYASDELKNSSSPKDFDKIFNWFRKLGRFKEYKGSTGKSTTYLIGGKGKQTTGLYEAHAEFETGPATIIIMVIKKGHKWQVLDLGFHINSMALANQ